MNEGNTLAGVDVPTVSAGFGDMMKLQIDLQARLNQLPVDPTDAKRMASKCIYWGHCIRAEIEELIEWPTLHASDPNWVKEMQMEAIDIVHFVFNIGIELGFDASFVVATEQAYMHLVHIVYEVPTLRAISLMSEITIIDIVNALPWKTWKTYTTRPDMGLLAECYSDLLRAMLMLCNATGLDRQGIIDMYFAKNKVNHKRQDDGY